MANLLEEVEIIEGQDSRLLQVTDKSAQAKIGTLSNLETESKDNLVVALNEVLAEAKAIGLEIGDLTNLDTSNKTSIVNAINEIVALIGNADYMPAINVINYGLVNDGVTDNSTAFATLYATHKNLYFPKGTYYFSQPIVLSNRCDKITGEGFDTVLLFNGNGITISNYYAELKDIVIKSKTNNSFGLKVIGSYNYIHNIGIYDSANVALTSLIVGDVNYGTWFNIFEHIKINDSNLNSTTGVGVKLTSSVNNLFSNIIIHAKQYGFYFDDDNTAGYSTDGCQITDSNITTCDEGLYAEGCTAIFIDNTIFDQILSRVFAFVSCGDCNLTECYLSLHSTLSDANAKIGDIVSSSGIRINNAQVVGNSVQYNGIAITSSSNVNIDTCTVGGVATAINFSDDNSTDCYISNILFNNVTNRLYLQGYSNHYSNLKGAGVLILANTFNQKSMFATGVIQIADAGTEYTYDYDFPISTISEASIFTIGVELYNTDATLIHSLLPSQSSTGYIKIRFRKVDGNMFANESFNFSFMVPID